MTDDQTMRMSRKIRSDKEGILAHLEERRTQEADLAVYGGIPQKKQQYHRGFRDGLEYAQSTIKDWQISETGEEPDMRAHRIATDVVERLATTQGLSVYNVVREIMIEEFDLS